MAAPIRFLSRTALFHISHSEIYLGQSKHVLTSVAVSTNRPNYFVNQQQVTIVRNNSFFNRLPATQLWESVAGNPGKKRARGKRVGKRKKTDLNRGQIIGEGKSNMVWPGLNAPVMKGKEVVRQKQLPPNPEKEAEIIRLRDKMQQKRSQTIPPLQRGWAGSRWPGQSIGQPDPIGDYTFQGFDTRVLEFKTVTNMTATFGRKQRFSAFVVTGNGNGIAGFAKSKAPNGRAALRQAKNKAAQRLQYIQLYDNHTVFHNFFSKFHYTSMFVEKKHRGHGLICHRALKTICEVIGIKDLYAKVEGRTKNKQNLTKAFFDGLGKQETHQQLADRLQLNVVETREEMDNVPLVVGRPSSGKSRTVSVEEDLDFEREYYGGKVRYVRPKIPPFYHKSKSWKKKQDVLYKRQHQFEAQIVRWAGSEV